MASELLTVTAVSQLTPVISTVVLAIPIHPMLKAPSGPFATSGGQEMLLESDIDASFKDYVTPYVNAAYSVPGVLKYSSLKSIADLSTLVTKDGDPVGLKQTTGTIVLEVTVPAQTPPIASSPDATPTYDVDFEFTFAGQTLTTSD